MANPQKLPIPRVPHYLIYMLGEYGRMSETKDEDK